MIRRLIPYVALAIVIAGQYQAAQFATTATDAIARQQREINRLEFIVAADHETTDTFMGAIPISQLARKPLK